MRDPEKYTWLPHQPASRRPRELLSSDEDQWTPITRGEMWIICGLLAPGILIWVLIGLWAWKHA